jgi:hypothetical protein
MKVAAIHLGAVAVGRPAPSELAVVPDRHGIVGDVERNRRRCRNVTGRLGIIRVLNELEREGVVPAQIGEDLGKGPQEFRLECEAALHTQLDVLRQRANGRADGEHSAASSKCAPNEVVVP